MSVVSSGVTGSASNVAITTTPATWLAQTIAAGSPHRRPRRSPSTAAAAAAGRGSASHTFQKAGAGVAPAGGKTAFESMIGRARRAGITTMQESRQSEKAPCPNCQCQLEVEAKQVPKGTVVHVTMVAWICRQHVAWFVVSVVCDVAGLAVVV